MAGMGLIWDRTMAVLRARAGTFALIAGVLMVLPGVAQTVLRAFLPAQTASGLTFVAGALGIAVAALSVWGMIAITVVGSDPAAGAANAIARARDRLPAAIGILLVAGTVATVVSLVLRWLLATLGVDLMRPDQTLPVRSGTAAIAIMAVAAIVSLFVLARFLPLFAVVANERRGLGAFARAYALTRGVTLRLVGVLLLYGLVLAVVGPAATLTSGVVARIALGAEATRIVALVPVIVTLVVTAGLSIVQLAFCAQFYLAAAARRPA